MIKKILDNYYSNKLINYCKSCLQRYIIDIRITETKTNVDIEIKMPKYNDKQFISIFNFHKGNAFIYLCEQEEIKKILLERAKKYSESQV